MLGRIVSILLIAGSALMSAPAHAASTYYVSTTGDNANSGTQARPFRTVQKAVNVAPAGSVIVVANGTYDGFTVTKAVTVQGASRDGVVIKPLTARRDVVLIKATGADVRRLTVRGCVPVAAPAGGLDDFASSGIRVDDGVAAATITNVVVDGNRSRGTGRIGCHGVFLHNAQGVIVSNSTMLGNGSGVFVRGGGSGIDIVNNTIRDNDVLIRNTSGGNDDFGAIGIGFGGIGEDPGPVARDNTIIGNQGHSFDYGTDGAGFEIFDASNLRMEQNTIADNDVILETGSSSPAIRCSNNVFTRNEATGDSSPETAAQDPLKGMILRCAHLMQITSNTIAHADYWSFQIGNEDPTFGSSIDGLVITDNVVVQGWDKFYGATTDPAAWVATIDRNAFSTPVQIASNGGAPAFATIEIGSTREDIHTLTRWRERTPHDDNSTISCASGSCS